MLARSCRKLTIWAMVLFSMALIVHASTKGTTDTDNGSPGTAFAHVYADGNHVTAKGKVHATRAARHGAWAVSVSVPGDYDGNAGHYTRGLSTQFHWVRGVGEEDDGNSTAWISGHNARGEAFFCHAQEP